MHNHMYLEREQLIEDMEDDELRFDFLESHEVILPNNICKNIDMEQFLHGHCLLFAYRLQEEFGYELLFDYEDESCEHLVHAYCCGKENGNVYFIDIRGITDACENEKQMVLSVLERVILKL